MARFFLLQYPIKKAAWRAAFENSVMNLADSYRLVGVSWRIYFFSLAYSEFNAASTSSVISKLSSAYNTAGLDVE
ncbi:hypothetical protein SAMN05444682_11050 [Parapedobacter indicus]|uniref:Uncharacterized protein n=1 Tax=Parapedobacter indicus TaxID=1477437 RepID=A0A1I3RMH0_9SPHI|nr:hypothetical protein CLV26_110196 [Parapedobacter indicus]SFJ47220.1 hypothetical protein SAMN05444682_11050 [Parapedobacter indicus]